jgi:NTE family protein
MRYLFTILFLLNVATATAQQQRPKVGLVLSGGGAKGLAHIGVLKYLEEQQIPVDYIVGTSMGGVVGAYYAAGYSATQIESIVLQPEFQEWATGTFTPENTFLYARNSQVPTPFRFQLFLEEQQLRTSLSSGFVNDGLLNFALLKYLTIPAQQANNNFDNLPIPYRCVAAELFTESIVVPEEGNLAAAVRATMSVPLVFRPVKIDGRYLYDGGVYNNFPIDIMLKEFSPDYIIGVNVSDEILEEYPSKQDEKLIENALAYLVLRNSDKRSLRDKDIYIKVDVGEYSAISFDAAEPLVNIGYEAAVAQVTAPDIAKLRQQENYWLQRSDIPELLTEPLVSVVEVKGAQTEGQKRYVQKLIKPWKGRISLNQLEQNYYRLISDNYFSDISPRLYQLPDSTQALELTINPVSKIDIGFGGNTASRSIGSIYLDAKYAFIGRTKFTLSGNAIAGRFNSSALANAQLLFPARNPIIFDALLRYNKRDYSALEEFFSPDLLPQNHIIRKEVLIGGQAVRALAKRSLLMLGGGYFTTTNRYYPSSTYSTTDIADKTELDGLTAWGEVMRSSLNRVQFANRGLLLQLKAQMFLADEQHQPGTTSSFSSNFVQRQEWLELKAKLEHWPGSRQSNWRTGYSLELAASSLQPFRNYSSTLLHSQAYLPYIDSYSLYLSGFRAPTFAAAGITESGSLSEKVELRLAANGFVPLQEVVQTTESAAVITTAERKLNFSAAATFVYHSRIGPLSASVQHYRNEPQQLLYLLNFGVLFTNPFLFN